MNTFNLTHGRDLGGKVRSKRLGAKGMQPEEETQPLKSTIKQAGKGKSGHSVERMNLDLFGQNVSKHFYYLKNC